MTLGNDFSLPDGEDNPSPSAGHNLRSVIVIENRNRSLASRLMPPALILLAALAIASYQRKTPVWPLTPQPQTVSHASPFLASAALAAPSPSPRVGGVKNEIGAAERLPEALVPARAIGNDDPDRPSGTDANPEPVRLPSPFDLDTADGLSPLTTPAPGSAADSTHSETPAGRGSTFRRPETDSTDATSQPAPFVTESDHPATPSENQEPSKDEILRDIEREAEQKDAKRQDLEGLKNNARGILLNEALTKADSERAPFLDELKVLVGRMGDGAGKEIEKLGQRYGKEPLPQVKVAYSKLLRTAPKRWSRPAKVATMRAIGVPEPLILDQICHDFDKLVNTRGGPRTEDEVRVRAARALLAIPVIPIMRKPADSPADPHSSRWQDINASSTMVTNLGTRASSSYQTGSPIPGRHFLPRNVS